MLSDIVFVSYVGTNGLNDDQVRVMYPNGKVATLTYDEDDSDAVTAGNFYEYEVTNDVYELHTPKLLNNPNAGDNENYYGDYTYYGARALTTSTGANTGAPAAYFGGITIDDNADVIVFADDKDNPGTNTSVKHITGKQLKSVANALNLTANDDSTINRTLIRNTAIGGFVSEVDGFDRATVLAVRYNSADGEFGLNMSGLESNSNYGFIISDAVKVDGGIRFDMITADSDTPVTVIADRNTVAGFDKGCVVGYSSLTEIENSEFMSINDPTIIGMGDGTNGILAASISATNGTDKVTAGGYSEMDLDNFTTVIYTNSYANTIDKVVDGSPRKASDGRTNILFINGEVAIIDANQIVGDVYTDNTVTATGFANSASVQWTDATTGETWAKSERGAYDNAVLNVSITTKTSGTVTLTNNGVSKTYDIEANKPLKIEGIIVAGDIELVYGGGSDSTDRGNITITTDNKNGLTASKVATSVDGDGDLTIAVQIPQGAANISADVAVTIDTIPVSAVRNAAAGGYVTWTVTGRKIAPSNNVVVDVSNLLVNYGAAATVADIQAALNQPDANVKLDKALSAGDELTVPNGAMLEVVENQTNAINIAVERGGMVNVNATVADGSTAIAEPSATINVNGTQYIGENGLSSGEDIILTVLTGAKMQYELKGDAVLAGTLQLGTTDVIKGNFKVTGKPGAKILVHKTWAQDTGSGVQSEWIVDTKDKSTGVEYPDGWLAKIASGTRTFEWDGNFWEFY